MWKFPLATAFAFLTLVSPAVADPDTLSVSEIQRAYDRAYPNQKIFDDSNVLQDRSRNTAESSVLAPDTHAGKNGDGKLRAPVELKAPQQQAQESQGGMMAGNPPTSTLLGLTELKYPYEKASHYGPPSYYEYMLLFRYTPPPMVTNLDVGQQFGSQAAAQSWFQKGPTTFGIPLTDSGDYINKMTLNAKLVDQITSPSRWAPVAQVWQQAQQQDMANSTAKAGEVSFAADLANIEGDLANIANENVARPAQPNAKTRSVEEVTWMVQQVYKKIYVPMALLLILPGALLTQASSMVSYGFRLPAQVSSPFEGLLKSMIAIFLIPATQLIVSYSIDVGNTMTHVVASYNIDPKTLLAYANAQLYDVPFQNSANQLVPSWDNVITRDPALEDVVIFDLDSFFSSIISGISNFFGSLGSWFGFDGSTGGTVGGATSPVSDVTGGLGIGGGTGDSGSSSAGGVDPYDRGKVTQAPEEKSQLETQSRMTTQMQFGLNAMNMVDCSIVSILLQFQTVMMCYLMLLGPIAAAFYAWPASNNLFKNAFSSWLNGVITLSMWRFWWCTLLLVMNVRIQWLQDMGQYAINSEWESLVFMAFSVLMAAVPFNPFQFKLGDLAGSVLQKASDNVSNGASSGGASGGKSGAASSGATAATGGGAGGSIGSGAGGSSSGSAGGTSAGSSSGGYAGTGRSGAMRDTHYEAEAAGGRGDGSDGERGRAPLEPISAPPMTQVSTSVQELNPPPMTGDSAEG